MRFRVFAGLAILAGFCAGCDSATGPEVIDTASIRVVHAASGTGRVTVRIPGEDEATLSFKGSTRFFARPPGDSRVTVEAVVSGRRLLAAIEPLEENKYYTFALIDGAAGVESMLIENPLGNSGGDGVVLDVINFSEATGAVDIYLEAPTADLAGAQPVGTPGFREIVTDVQRAAGEYRLSVTETGTPANVLFASDDLTLNGSTSVLLALIDSAGTINAPFSVLSFTGVGDTAELVSRDVSSQLRVMHGARGTDGLDVIVAGDTPSTLFADVAFGSVTDYADLPSGEVTLDVTPAGDPGVLVTGTQVLLSPPTGSLITMYLAPTATAGMVQEVPVLNDNRRLASQARLRFFHAAISFPFVDIYLVEPGVDITTVDATFPGHAFRLSTNTLEFEPGTYDIIVTEALMTTPISVAGQFVLEAGSLYGVTLVDSADMLSVEFALQDDFPATP